MPLPEPQRRFMEFSKRNLSGLGMLVVANIIFMIVYQIALSTAIMPFVLIMVVLQMGFLPLVFLSGGICMPFLCLFMLVFLVVLIGIEFVAISGMYGWYIYLARKVLDVKEGRRVELTGIMDEVRTDWKYYFKKGAGMLGFYLLVITPIIIVIFTIPVTVMILSVFIMEHQYFILTYILFYLMITFISMLLSPILQFILDVGSLRIAQGMKPWEGLSLAVKDIIRRKSLFGPYYVTMLLVTLVSFVLFPLATFIRWILPVASKVFIVANDDL